jgi:ubiquinone/menaquinone biosynthesis C-methylase UbiE
MNKELEWTGERYVPQLKGNIALEHLHRYAFASEYVKGKVILDIASGEGYGSTMLSYGADYVYGIDIDVKSVEHAKQKYKSKNVEYKVGSCTDIPLHDSSVDIVVSFETIEHITDHDQMMSEVRRVLKPGGKLIISSPDKNLQLVPESENPFHWKELTPEELEALLKKYFNNVVLMGQKVQFGSVIASLKCNTLLRGTYTSKDILKNISYCRGVNLPRYIIGICSDLQISDTHSSLMEGDIIWSEEFQKNKKDSYESEIAIKNNQLVILSLREKINRIEASRSWKITAPLRYVFNCIIFIFQKIKNYKNDQTN